MIGNDRSENYDGVTRTARTVVSSLPIASPRQSETGNRQGRNLKITPNNSFFYFLGTLRPT